MKIATTTCCGLANNFESLCIHVHFKFHRGFSEWFCGPERRSRRELCRLESRLSRILHIFFHLLVDFFSIYKYLYTKVNYTNCYGVPSERACSLLRLRKHRLIAHKFSMPEKIAVQTPISSWGRARTPNLNERSAFFVSFFFKRLFASPGKEDSRRLSVSQGKPPGKFIIPGLTVTRDNPRNITSRLCEGKRQNIHNCYRKQDWNYWKLFWSYAIVAPAYRVRKCDMLILPFSQSVSLQRIKKTLWRWICRWKEIYVHRKLHAYCQFLVL